MSIQTSEPWKASFFRRNSTFKASVNFPRNTSLSTSLGRKVFDRTGLEGIYRIEMRSSRPDDFGVDPDVATALREQLGLELRAAKEPLDVVVVDHIERPSQN